MIDSRQASCLGCKLSKETSLLAASVSKGEWPASLGNSVSCLVSRITNTESRVVAVVGLDRAASIAADELQHDRLHHGCIHTRKPACSGLLEWRTLSLPVARCCDIIIWTIAAGRLALYH